MVREGTHGLQNNKKFLDRPNKNRKFAGKSAENTRKSNIGCSIVAEQQ
jgi:hypothetical protein